MRPIALCLAACSLAACTKGPESDGRAEPKDPSPYVVDEETSPVPSASIDEISQAFQAGIDAVMELGAPPVRDAYLAAMQGASANCPDAFSGPDGDYWFDDCTSPAGTSFSGYVFDYASYDVVDPYSGGTYDQWYLYGGATIQTAAGERMDLGGGVSMYEIDDGFAQTWQSSVQGTFTWDGPQAGGTWLDEGYDPDLSTYFQVIPTYDARVAYVDGGIGGLGPDLQWAASFDEAVMFDIILGGDCDLEPAGQASVRAADGSWYDLKFHASDGYSPGTGPCDGCGDLFFRGEPMGEACADFSAWLGWGGAPWSY